jgi:hypothetical protein
LRGTRAATNLRLITLSYYGGCGVDGDLPRREKQMKLQHPRLGQISALLAHDFETLGVIGPAQAPARCPLEVREHEHKCQHNCHDYKDVHVRA